jgi:hypothetical protein
MKLIGAVKGLVQDFWHDNTRPSSNQKDVLKLRRGSRDHEPHIKHYLDITQTKLYERFIKVHSALNLGQISFHKCKPWYVRINTIHNTCCCRYHIEYGYYYDTHTHTHISCFSQHPFVGMPSYIVHCRHLETLFTTSCVQGHRVLHFIKMHA